MAHLSNLLGFSDGSRRDRNKPLPQTQIRPAHRQEIEPALRLILTGRGAPTGDEHLMEFIAFAINRNIDLANTWVALADGQVVWAALPVYSPGKTMLLLVPGTRPVPATTDVIRRLLDEVCVQGRSQGVELAQILVSQIDPAMGQALALGDFSRIGELVYLQRALRSSPPDFVLPAGVRVVGYNASTHGLFADTLARTYGQSLDCPMLNGMRQVEDIIAGHKGAGVFDPSWWKLLCDDGHGVGLVLLCGVPETTTMELVYLGLAPEARGRGLGDVMMRLAMRTAVEAQRDQLTLAVDSGNSPALGLYHRHGLRRVGTRIAMLRDLRRISASPS
jgi:GNAT superfamily N-acetyltransferase